MEYWQIGLLILVGSFAGWINVLAGGGSLLTVPTLIFMDIPAPIANGTNRIAIVTQNIVAVYAFYRKGFHDIKLTLSLSFFACIGAIGGAYVGIGLEGVWFNRVLAIIMILILIFMANEKNVPPSKSVMQIKNLILGHVLIIFAGFWGGLIQIGVGFIIMPILHNVMGIDLVRVNMLKISIILAFTVISLIIYSANLELIWWAGFGLAIGNSLGGWYGAQSSINKGEKWIKPIFYITISVLIFKLLLF